MVGRKSENGYEGPQNGTSNTIPLHSSMMLTEHFVVSAVHHLLTCTSIHRLEFVFELQLPFGEGSSLFCRQEGGAIREYVLSSQ
mmetsp:Transcript_19952/g.30053  ORF Transcript_19952/g.30053 Transcript_19952/m.30053 type:complete len:84 (+) Transcript_19952:406-657(+)